MSENIKIRSLLFFLFVVFSVIYLLPNFTPLPKSWWFHNKPLNYGLDIQGGAHLVYGVDVMGVLQERTERTARAIAQELKDQGLEGSSVEPNEAKDVIFIKLASETDRVKAREVLEQQYATSLQTILDEGTQIQLRYFDAVVDTYSKQVIDQAIEVIRNRVDEFGVAEPVIAAQGRDRILVQLPGLTDPARAKELINKTARLIFRIVDDETSPEQVAQWVSETEKEKGIALGKDGLAYAAYVNQINDALKNKLPPNRMISFEKAPQAVSLEAGKIPLLLKTDADVSGDLLEDAFVSFGQYGEPNVSFRFGSEGRGLFGELTGKNVGKRLAIVLDQVVYSAPNINERIDGNGQITLGSRNYEEAQKEGQLIATALRAGALPAALQQLEERSVGPSLGADSIAKGKLAGIVGLVLVVSFISFYYKLTGVIASVCLALNIMGLMAILSALGATLTLPGIAGISLTMGMAVDANVIIFERIKEELAKGTAFRAAVRDGFNHAWSAIFDANVTTAIAAAILIYFGSGPVRGFGVTLIAGIVTTMITAVFVTHYLMDLFLVTFKFKKISI